jgi:hypothetical protein
MTLGDGPLPRFTITGHEPGYPKLYPADEKCMRRDNRNVVSRAFGRQYFPNAIFHASMHGVDESNLRP